MLITAYINNMSLTYFRSTWLAVLFEGTSYRALLALRFNSPVTAKFDNAK